ncbi:hypothetical protein GCM10027321_03550 [Massilia terrae]|uniref:PKD domain-containing protein n=1 Tax=Massilia terrae TaxID=1811224 RepID=A0ABT2CTI9_9BURK|nr:hypothetical protein [Massilia terrae]MCS0657281.1 hypothetical protein [Massilia terrae]
MLPRIESIRKKRQAHAFRWVSALLGSLALSGASSAAPRAASPTLYRVINLGPGDTGIAINAKGQVAMTHADPWDPPTRAWFYDGVRLHEIPPLGDGFIRTTGVNDHGQVTGVSSSATGFTHSFVWSKQRGTVDIGTLPGYTVAWEPAINNRGEIAATADSGGNAPWPHAFHWSAQNGAEDLGLLVPGPDSSAYARAINDDGMIVGSAWAGGHSYQAYAWTRSGGMVNIDTINSRYSDPVAVGAKGQVAGKLLNDPNNYGNTFFWTAATGMRELGTGSGQGSGMFGMSSGGRIAGVVTYAGAFEKAMTWTPEQGMVELGTLGGHRSAAFAANNKGQVVGASVTPEDRYHAFLWSSAEGMTDLNQRLYRAPPGLELYSAGAISDDGSIAAASNAGLLLLKPVTGSGKGVGDGLVAGPITAPDSSAIGATLDASITFLADSHARNYTVTWSWGDGTRDRPIPVTINNGTGTATGRHIYSTADFLTISATIADAKGNTVTVTRFLYTYDPSCNFCISGTGSVMAPAQANPGWAGSGGIANFRFAAPSATSASVANARGGAGGRLYFSLGGRNFRSDDVRVQSTQGQAATLAGTGTIDGTSKYSFTLSAVAGGNGTAGSFGMKIWHIDPRTGAEVVDFDSQNANRRAGAELVAGRILIR